MKKGWLIYSVTLVMALVVFVLGSANQVFSVLPPDNLEPCGVIELPFKTYHVQGLAVTDKWYFLSAVDKDHGHGFLWQIDRATLEATRVEIETKSPDGVDVIHPGGIDYDGVFLWVPVAGYTRDGPSVIYKIDPDTLEVLDEVWFPDHIGGIVSDGEGTLFLFNWDTVHLYVCDESGTVKQTFVNPGLSQCMGYVCAYQDADIDPDTGLLLCSGDTRKPYDVPDGYKFGFPYFHGYSDEFGMLDWIDPKTGEVIQRVLLGHVGYGRARTRLGREGFAYYKGVYYFAPEDNITRIYLYKFVKPTKPYFPEEKD